MSTYLLHCFACDDTRYVIPTRTFCGCERSSARVLDGAIVLVGPARVFEAGRDHLDMDVVRPSVIAM